MADRRAEALARLDVFIGDWTVEVRFPGTTAGDAPVARSRFEWTLDRQFLLQRTEIPVPEAPDGLMLIGADQETGAYTQHYYDSRGVARLYAMTFDGRTWTLKREAADFTPLDFHQRFTGTFDDAANTLTAAWETRQEGQDWQLDFDLVYRRAT
ncbi:hypothetical protein [Streptomyces sp. NPDC048172]|uniref:hypothetical protein n=1 Tax=Streptomyces sp. NPDC048172 TaxID=3365505 RepID=UPI00371B99A5